MRILFNCINNVSGGGVQNAANFIYYALSDIDNDYLFLVSPEVNEVLISWGIKSGHIIVLEDRKSFFYLRREVRQIERVFLPDLVYTMAGPSYVFFRGIHLLGTSDPYITHAKLQMFFFRKTVIDGFKSVILEMLKGIVTRISGSYFVFQTPASQKGFCKRFFCSLDKTAVVPNAIGQDFIGKGVEYKPWRVTSGDRTVLCPSAYYSHKNIEIIFEAAQLLVERGCSNIKFLLTISADVFATLSGRYPEASKLIDNYGPYNYSSALSVYEKADAVIMPSLLETFSTVYIEAMALGLPIFTPREEFAVDICGNYSIYYESQSVTSLLDVLTSDEDVSKLVERISAQNDRLAQYGTQEGRYRALVKLFRTVLDANSYKQRCV